MDDHEARKATGARVRAARLAAGYRTRQSLADDVKLPRFGEKTIGSVERGERTLYEHEAAEIARLLDVDPDYFFPADRPAETQLDRIERKLNTILHALELIPAPPAASRAFWTLSPKNGGLPPKTGGKLNEQLPVFPRRRGPHRLRGGRHHLHPARASFVLRNVNDRRRVRHRPTVRNASPSWPGTYDHSFPTSGGRPASPTGRRSCW